jgi:hypothetical protein
MQNPFSRIFRFYRDGFAGMQLGKTLWFIILLKLFILFLIIKPFFFPDILQTRFRSNDQRAAFVFRQLSESASAAQSAAATRRPAVDAASSSLRRHAMAR